MPQIARFKNVIRCSFPLKAIFLFQVISYLIQIFGVLEKLKKFMDKFPVQRNINHEKGIKDVYLTKLSALKIRLAFGKKPN